MDSPLRILNGPVITAPSDNEDGDKMDIENHNDDGMESEDGIGDVAEKKSEEDEEEDTLKEPARKKMKLTHTSSYIKFG